MNGLPTWVPVLGVLIACAQMFIAFAVYRSARARSLQEPLLRLHEEFEKFKERLIVVETQIQMSLEARATRLGARLHRDDDALRLDRLLEEFQHHRLAMSESNIDELLQRLSAIAATGPTESRADAREMLDVLNSMLLPTRVAKRRPD